MTCPAGWHGSELLLRLRLGAENGVPEVGSETRAPGHGADRDNGREMRARRGQRKAITNSGDYLVLEAVFSSALAGVFALTARRGRTGAAGISRAELPVLALATFALADVLAKERISTWLREPFVVESADHRPLEPAGRGMRRAVGELLTCTRCAGTWSALGLVGLRTAFPLTGQVTINVLALTGANDILQAGFRGLTELSNVAASQLFPTPAAGLRAR